MKEAEPETEKTNNGAPESEPLVPVDAGSITPEQLEELKARASRADDHWDRLLRTTADFENFKKRAARERQEAVRYANEALMEKLVPVLDNFEMAMAAVPAGSPDALESLRAGVAMIHQQLRNTLAEAGLEEVDATGKAFDPRWHEAVSQAETDELPEGSIVQQLRKGYKLRDRLLRPAAVVVAKQPGSRPK